MDLFEWSTHRISEECRREARASLTPTVLRDQHRAILDALQHRPGGLTDEEGQEITGLNPSSYRPRRGELAAMGRIVEAGEKRRTASGRFAAVWKVAP